MFPLYFNWEPCSSISDSGEPGKEVPYLPPPSNEAESSPPQKVDIGLCARAPVGGPRDRSVQTTSPVTSSRHQKCGFQKKPTVSVQELDLLLCPVCLNIPQDQVYSCPNGHSFCDQCAKKLNLCPLCRTDFKKESMRNYALERLLDLKRFQCLYKEDGCRRTDMNRKRLIKHLENCGFHPAATKLCSMMKFHDWTGFSVHPRSCQYSVRLESILNNSDQTSDFIRHLSRFHRFAHVEILLSTTTTTILEVVLTKLSSSGNRPHPKNEIFSNLIIQTNSGRNNPLGLYFLVIRVDYQEGQSKLEENLSLACVRLTPPPDGNGKGGQIMFSIKGSPLRGISDISWLDHPLTLEQVSILMSKDQNSNSHYQFHSSRKTT